MGNRCTKCQRTINDEVLCNECSGRQTVVEVEDVEKEEF